jgi:CRP-like cAMP-binding protein
MREEQVARGFWGTLTEKERAALTTTGRTHVFPRGAALCVEGELSTHLFILLGGWVKISSVSAEGREMLLALRGQGDFVGEMAGQLTGYRTATVRAADRVQSLITSNERFTVFLDAHPGAAQAYRTAMAEHQREAYEKQRSGALTSGAQRLARLLLDLANRHGTVSHAGVTIAFPLSQEELANLIGVSRATVTRALGDWRSRRLIRTHQLEVTIMDAVALRRIAGRLGWDNAQAGNGRQ